MIINYIQYHEELLHLKAEYFSFNLKNVSNSTKQAHTKKEIRILITVTTFEKNHSIKNRTWSELVTQYIDKKVKSTTQKKSKLNTFCNGINVYYKFKICTSIVCK